jgi:hypothetical protein
MQWLVGTGAVVSWALLWALSAGVITALWVTAARKVEHYLVISDRWTFSLWIFALSLAPACAFYGNWILWGLIVPESLYLPVRMGCLVAGCAFAALGLLVVLRPAGEEEQEDRTGEVPTLIGSLLVDAIFCAALIWRFEPIAALMRQIGEG